MKTLYSNISVSNHFKNLFIPPSPLSNYLFVTFSQVIGDKKGGVTSQLLVDPNKMGILKEISQVVQVPMKFIHITRNPFDNIATMMLRRLRVRDDVRGKEVKVSFKDYIVGLL